jgi:uncharacterized protein
LHAVLHLTSACNMRCSYCYVDRSSCEVMTPEVMRQAVDFALRHSPDAPSGVSFFGGEPLLHKDLIVETVDYCRFLGKRDGARFHLKLTTNGLLLDDAFVDYAAREGIYVALSIDGTPAAHDACRVDHAGHGTHGRVAAAARRLLASQRCSPAMMVISPSTVDEYAAGVDHLFRLGFRYIICTLDYAAPWDRKSLSALKREYRALAQWYAARTRAEDKFYFSPFEVKIASRVTPGSWCEQRCELAMHHVSVAPDGTLYPCVQFVGDASMAVGHVQGGWDEKKRLSLFALNAVEKSECAGCAIRSRCLHTCGCLNRQVTGRLDRVAPSLCAHERILLPVADRLAARLYRGREAMFIQKHYNDMYPLISALEDDGAASS